MKDRIKILSIFVLGVMAITITLGAVVYHAASASPSVNQEADPDSSADTTSDNSADTSRDRTLRSRPGGGLRSGYTDEDLASALEITVEELQAARSTAYTAGLAEAVEQGLITQAQADELTDKGETFPLGNRSRIWLTQQGIDFNVLLSEALGISVDELQAAKVKAYNAHIDQAVTDGTLTQEQADMLKGQYALRKDETFQTSMQTAFEAAVAAAVKDGVITQAQADLILEKASSRASVGFELGGLRSLEYMGGRPSRGHRGGGQPADASVDNQSPTSTP